MSKKSPQNSGPPSGLIALPTLLVLGVVAAYNPTSALALLLLGVFGLVCISVVHSVCQRAEELSQRRLRRRKERRHLAEKKSTESVRAQLDKRDFNTRLSSFVKTNQNNDETEDFTSQRDFWERNESYVLSPTRPVELLRHLLRRIAKLVGRN